MAHIHHSAARRSWMAGQLFESWDLNVTLILTGSRPLRTLSAASQGCSLRSCISRRINHV